MAGQRSPTRPRPPRTTRDQLPRTRLTDAFERRVRAVLDACLTARERLVVACSGGPDSTAALVAVSRSRPADTVTAACFDHGLRPLVETEGDRAAVDAVAQWLDVPVVAGAAPDAREVGRGEAGARGARYRWLAEVCREARAGACVTGHTLDDQAETVLLRLARGSGLAGAAAMAPESPWPLPEADPRGRLRVLRPLLDVSRQEVEAYLDALCLEARLDDTNALLRIDRNRIRHRVLPQLRQINPRAAEQIGRFADLAREDEAALHAWALSELEGAAAFAPGRVRVDRHALVRMPPAIGSRVLRLAGDRIGLRLDGAQVRQLLGIARRRNARATLAGGAAHTDDEALELRAG